MIFYGASGGDKGIEKSKLKNWNFFYSDCRFRFLAKKYECKVVFIFLYLDVITAKIKKNVQICQQMIIVALFSKILNEFLDFSYANI